MQYKSKTIVRELPHHLQSLGISLSKPVSTSYYTTIGRAAFKAKKLQKAIVNQTFLQLEKECRKLVKQKKSVLRSTSVKELMAFKWTKLIEEWQAQAPTLYKCLKTIVNNAFNSKLASKLKPFIGTAGAILLKGRNKRMSAVQHLIGLCLFLGRTRKILFWIYFFYVIIVYRHFRTHSRLVNLSNCLTKCISQLVCYVPYCILSIISVRSGLTYCVLVDSWFMWYLHFILMSSGLL